MGSALLLPARVERKSRCGRLAATAVNFFWLPDACARGTRVPSRAGRRAHVPEGGTVGTYERSFVGKSVLCPKDTGESQGLAGARLKGKSVSPPVHVTICIPHTCFGVLRESFAPAPNFESRGPSLRRWSRWIVGRLRPQRMPLRALSGRATPLSLGICTIEIHALI